MADEYTKTRLTGTEKIVQQDVAAFYRGFATGSAHYFHALEKHVLWNFTGSLYRYYRQNTAVHFDC